MFAEVLAPENGLDEITGINPMDDVALFAETINPDEDIMVVGHMPFLGKLTSLLLAGSPDMTVVKFQNGGIVSLVKGDDTDLWAIKWTLMPCVG